MKNFFWKNKIQLSIVVLIFVFLLLMYVRSDRTVESNQNATQVVDDEVTTDIIEIIDQSGADFTSHISKEREQADIAVLDSAVINEFNNVFDETAE